MMLILPDGDYPCPSSESGEKLTAICRYVVNIDQWVSASEVKMSLKTVFLFNTFCLNVSSLGVFFGLH